MEEFRLLDGGIVRFDRAHCYNIGPRSSSRAHSRQCQLCKNLQDVLLAVHEEDPPSARTQSLVSFAAIHSLNVGSTFIEVHGGAVCEQTQRRRGRADMRGLAYTSYLPRGNSTSANWHCSFYPDPWQVASSDNYGPPIGQWLKTLKKRSSRSIDNGVADLQIWA